MFLDATVPSRNPSLGASQQRISGRNRRLPPGSRLGLYFRAPERADSRCWIYPPAWISVLMRASACYSPPACFWTQLSPPEIRRWERPSNGFLAAIAGLRNSRTPDSLLIRRLSPGCRLQLYFRAPERPRSRLGNFAWAGPPCAHESAGLLLGMPVFLGATFPSRNPSLGVSQQRISGRHYS